jgi:hypothetical protein
VVELLLDAQSCTILDNLAKPPLATLLQACLQYQTPSPVVYHRRRTQTCSYLLMEWEINFELLYYQQQVDRLHLVCPCLHAVVHAARETVRCGPLNLLAQWVLENTIGNLRRKVHQHSNPFMNLSQRGLLHAQTNMLQEAIVPELVFQGPVTITGR